MSLSIYAVAITPLLAGLSTLSRYLDKAEAYAAENKIDPAVLAGARLAPDMLPLAGQVQRASDSAKAAVGRLTGLEVPSFADTETTLAELLSEPTTSRPLCDVTLSEPIATRRKAVK